MEFFGNIGYILSLGVFLGLVDETISYTGMWWALGTITAVDETQFTCSQIPGLSIHPDAVRHCNDNKILMPSVADGAKLGIFECQYQFEGRRWNCSTIEGDSSVFGNVLDKASREAAFVNAILSAGLVHSLTRACARGEYLNCNCDRRNKAPPGKNREYDDIQANDTWRWGGCSEDVRFGVKFSRRFLNNIENVGAPRGLMNTHNNEAGRQVVLRNMELKCKCHGISGSCELKTCWWQMASFRTMGDVLKVKYDSAAEMMVANKTEGRRTVKTALEPRYPTFKSPTEKDLVYYETSPNYCEYNPEVGSLGTTGRECNKTSHGIDGCELLCCGRGHNTQTITKIEKCECRFVWCCEVVCKKCSREVDVHTCK